MVCTFLRTQGLTLLFQFSDRFGWWLYDLNIPDIRYIYSSGKVFLLPLMMIKVFFHLVFSDLLINMLGLYLFGSIVASRIGIKGFLSLYLSTAIFENLIMMAIYLVFLKVDYSGIWGAETLVTTVTAAAFCMLSKMPMRIPFLPFSVKIKTMAIIFIVLSFFLPYLSETSAILKGDIPFMLILFRLLIYVFSVFAGFFFIKVLFPDKISTGNYGKTTPNAM